MNRKFHQKQVLKVIEINREKIKQLRMELFYQYKELMRFGGDITNIDMTDALIPDIKMEATTIHKQARKYCLDKVIKANPKGPASSQAKYIYQP